MPVQARRQRSTCWFYGPPSLGPVFLWDITFIEARHRFQAVIKYRSVILTTEELTSHFHHRELIMQGRIEIRARLISRSFVCGKQTTTKKLLVGSEHLLHGVTHRQAGNRV